MKRTNWLFGAAAVLAISAACVGCKKGDAPAPQDPEAEALNAGEAAINNADWARAYDKFTDAVAANANDATAYYGRAAAATQIAQGHYSLAKAAATNKDEKTGLDEAAKADDYFDRAKKDCDKILELDPQYADAYFLKGVIAQYQGAWEAGIEAFTECIKLSPENGEAHHRRGEIYDHIGDYMNSSVDFKKASELGFTDGSETASEALPSDPNDFSDLNYDPEAGAEEEPAENAE